jgi:HTH-type transcriptional regulator / antitoxin HigA
MKLETNWASPPGDTISRLMLLREIPEDELADGLGLHTGDFHLLLTGQARITSQIAEALADTLGSTSRFWLARDTAYVDARERLAKHVALDASTWVKAMPIKSMKEFNWLSPKISKQNLSDEVLKFFGCETLEEWNLNYSGGLGNIAFRTSFAFEIDTMATLVWLRAGEKQAQLLPLKEFNKNAFRNLLPRLKKLSAFKHPRTFLPKLKEACQSVGVALTTARAPSGCRASGATWTLDGGNPIIHLSFRHRSEDHFWFSFFHEAGHVLLHDGEHIDIEGGDAAPFDNEQVEREADNFAQDALVPTEMLNELKESNPNSKKVMAFAREAGVTPGIIVGQLEKAGVIPHGKMYFLKHTYHWDVDAVTPSLNQPRK